MRVLSVALLSAAAQAVAVTKPEQIRSDQDPVFHYYLQAYPKNSKYSRPGLGANKPLNSLLNIV
jgi:hypothetical protein